MFRVGLNMVRQLRQVRSFHLNTKSIYPKKQFTQIRQYTKDHASESSVQYELGALLVMSIPNIIAQFGTGFIVAKYLFSSNEFVFKDKNISSNDKNMAYLMSGTFISVAIVASGYVVGKVWPVFYIVMPYVMWINREQQPTEENTSESKD